MIRGRIPHFGDMAPDILSAALCERVDGVRGIADMLGYVILFYDNPLLDIGFQTVLCDDAGDLLLAQMLAAVESGQDLLIPCV
jgi:hypothetical protein